MIAFVLCVVAACGVVARARGVFGKRVDAAVGAAAVACPASYSRKERVVFQTAFLFLLVETSAVLWVFYRIGAGAQGRHLFPALVPSLTLLWLGIEQLAGVERRVVAAVTVVLLFATLDAAAWLLVAVPAYLG